MNGEVLVWLVTLRKYKIIWDHFSLSPLGMENQNQTNHPTNHSLSFIIMMLYEQMIEVNTSPKIEHLKMDDSTWKEVAYPLGKAQSSG